MPTVEFVDENDVVVGVGSAREAVEGGYIHRIARVFLFNSKGETLLTRRAGKLFIFPNRWDHSAAGHVDVGENYQEAAYRELKEEVGVEGVTLTDIAKMYIEEDIGQINKKKIFNTLFSGIYDGPLSPDPEEVSETRWVTLEEVSAWTKEKPTDFPPGFIASLEVLLKKKA